MAIALVGSNSAINRDAVDATITANSRAVTAGDLIVVQFSIFTGTAPVINTSITSITDGTNTYTLRYGTTTSADTTARCFCGIGWAIAASTATVTPAVNLANTTASNQFAAIGVSNFSGVDGTGTEVAHAEVSDYSISTNDINGGPVTMTAASDLIVGCAGFGTGTNDASQNWGSPTSWTNLFRNNNGYNTGNSMDSGYWLPGSIQSSYSPQWSHDNEAAEAASAVVVFKAAGVAQSQAPRSMYQFRQRRN